MGQVLDPVTRCPGTSQDPHVLPGMDPDDKQAGREPRKKKGYIDTHYSTGSAKYIVLSASTSSLEFATIT